MQMTPQQAATGFLFEPICSIDEGTGEEPLSAFLVAFAARQEAGLQARGEGGGGRREEEEEEEEGGGRRGV